MQLLIILSTFLGCAIGLENTCRETCKKSFPLHTFPKKDSHYACLRGCSLERIDQVTKDWKTNKVGAERTCEKDCSTIYSSNADSKNACQIGCKSAQPGLPRPAAMLKEEREKAGFYEHKSRVPLFLVIGRYCSGIYSVAVSYIGTKSTVFVKDGNKMSMSIEVESGPDYLQIDSIRKQPQMKQDENMNLDVKQSKSTWLDCVAHNVGLPKWFLAAALLLSLTSIFYLCCCTCFVAAFSEDKNHKFDSVFTIDADNMDKVPLYSGDQAPPLPPKYSEKGGIL